MSDTTMFLVFYAIWLSLPVAVFIYVVAGALREMHLCDIEIEKCDRELKRFRKAMRVKR